MSYFVDGLKSYRDLGAPRLPTTLVSIEDVEFARRMNLGEVAAIAGIDDHECVGEPSDESVTSDQVVM